MYLSIECFHLIVWDWLELTAENTLLGIQVQECIGEIGAKFAVAICQCVDRGSSNVITIVFKLEVNGCWWSMHDDWSDFQQMIHCMFGYIL